ncbi:MAG: hypothetical protein OEY59_13645 [Deltaproteobacteria bacterium]|nr:hypothetical protein [Deltaproteobacteria bacterium]
MLEKIKTVNKIEVLPDNLFQIQIRYKLAIMEDGVEIQSSIEREVITPGQDMTAKAAEIQAVAGAVWTPAVIDAWNAFVASQPQ